MTTISHTLIGLILLTSLSTSTFATKSKHHQCKWMDLSKALKKHKDTTPCTGKLIIDNHNVNRIPQRIPEIVCPSEMDNRCIELVLPMQVSIISGVNGQYDQKNIYVRSGCIDRKQIKKPPKPGNGVGNTRKNQNPSKVIGRPR